MAFMPAPENIVEHAKNAQQENRHTYFTAQKSSR